jgi:hypothetical protein
MTAPAWLKLTLYLGVDVLIAASRAIAQAIL